MKNIIMFIIVLAFMASAQTVSIDNVKIKTIVVEQNRDDANPFANCLVITLVDLSNKPITSPRAYYTLKNTNSEYNRILCTAIAAANTDQTIDISYNTSGAIGTLSYEIAAIAIKY